MKTAKPVIFLAAIVTLGISGGCMPHVKVVESYTSATEPNAKARGTTIDPYTYGGTASASGGTHAKSSYSSPVPADAPKAPSAPAKK